MKAKVYVVVITSNDDYDVEVTTDVFGTQEKAEEFLTSQYNDIKDDDVEYSYRYEEGGCKEGILKSFYIEIEDCYYWCSGSINESEVEL